METGHPSMDEWRAIAMEMRAKVEEVVPRLDAQIEGWIQSAAEVHDQLRVARAALLAITKVRWEDATGDAADEMQRLAREAYRASAWEMKSPAYVMPIDEGKGS